MEGCRRFKARNIQVSPELSSAKGAVKSTQALTFSLGLDQEYIRSNLKRRAKFLSPYFYLYFREILFLPS